MDPSKLPNPQNMLALQAQVRVPEPHLWDESGLARRAELHCWESEMRG
jgi:hypothetical protein